MKAVRKLSIAEGQHTASVKNPVHPGCFIRDEIIIALARQQEKKIKVKRYVGIQAEIGA